MTIVVGDRVKWLSASAKRDFKYLGFRNGNTVLIEDEHGDGYRVMISDIYPSPEENNGD